MKTEVRHDIHTFVRSGFYSPAEVGDIICHEIHELAGSSADEARAHIAACFDALKQEQKTWPATTDCDRLDAVFAALEHRGVIALQNAGYTQDDGYDDVCGIHHEAGDQATIVGYCFYTGQDLERAVDGDGLLLAFGPMNPEDEEIQGPMIGQIVVEELARQGFAVVWDGTFDQRIHVPGLDWKKRIA